MPTNGIPVNFESLRYIERKNQPLRPQQNQEGIATLSRYIPLSTKSTMSLFQTAKQRYTEYFTPVYGTSAVLRYMNENKLLRAQNEEGDTNTVYCHGIPLSGKTCVSLSCLGFRGRMFFVVLIVAKYPE